MRFDQVVIPLAPRSLANCLDLLLLLFRRGLGTYLLLWALVAGPACGLIYWLAYRYECTLLVAAAIGFLASGPLGLLVAAATAPAAFGDPLTVRNALRRLGPAAWRPLLRSLLARLVELAGLCVCAAPGIYLIIRDGFYAEQRLLSNLARHLHDKRTDRLLRGEMGDLIGRAIPLLAYGLLLWGVLVVTLDFASSRLLGLPVLLGRLQADPTYLADLGELIVAAFKFLGTDPLVESFAIGVALLVYSHLRIAWFLCYIDVRVRRDCWDLELQILQETDRLAGETA
ncbi:MAG: hypothetical protein EHM42_07590 [Planctomycetaceae bacterium]|nr:MAG: hypothetical protein EHM42_07590 [Planctomycetaceae bacterium]